MLTFCVPDDNELTCNLIYNSNPDVNCVSRQFVYLVYLDSCLKQQDEEVHYNYKYKQYFNFHRSSDTVGQYYYKGQIFMTLIVLLVNIFHLIKRPKRSLYVC